ncbi:RNA polymerase II-associated protein 3 isoform X1, partial [Tanacetum coccineum]
GSEFFKKRKFKEAVDCYSRSLALSPTAVAYANRTMAYLKLKRHVLEQRKKKEKKMEERNEDDASFAALFSEGKDKVSLLR